MGVEVFAADEQRSAPVDTLRWVRLAEAVLADEGVRGDSELSMLFVDEEAIADLNQRFLGKPGPTDVLAFPIDEEPADSGRSPDSGGTGPGFNSDVDEVPTLLGDVVICPSVARRNAPDHAGTYEDELALLVVHGVLHLLGMDHLEEEEAEAMEGRERELLARHHNRAAAAPAAGPAATGDVQAAGQEAPATGDVQAAGQEAPAAAPLTAHATEDVQAATAGGPPAADGRSEGGGRADDGPRAAPSA